VAAKLAQAGAARDLAPA